tara:strand:- start:189 stop:443 length:255 start_codon:yes stop_codon:yes gene_type:complete
MKILLLFSIFIILILLICRKFLYSAKSNLFKDQAAWSGKDLKIKYTSSKELSEQKGSSNYLKLIADESKIYLEDQSIKREDETK